MWPANACAAIMSIAATRRRCHSIGLCAYTGRYGNQNAKFL